MLKYVFWKERHVLGLSHLFQVLPLFNGYQAEPNAVEPTPQTP